MTAVEVAGRRDRSTSDDRIDALKRLARATVDRERANREFYAALVQAYTVGIRWRAIVLTCKAPEDTLRKRIRQLSDGIPDGFMWRV